MVHKQFWRASSTIRTNAAEVGGVTLYLRCTRCAQIQIMDE